VIEDDGFEFNGVNVKIEVRRGGIEPLETYFSQLDALCDATLSKSDVQFSSSVGLGRAAAIGAGLGASFAAHAVFGGFAISWGSWHLVSWCLYACALCFYHASEFATTMRWNASVASCQSFLLDQSREYQVAMAASWLEFWGELLLVPSLKTATLSKVVMLFGLVMMLVGQTFRTGSMVEAKSNFTHLIQHNKRKDHKLVTTGLYSYVRHPSYFGWFWWSIGTQILLVNPLCTVAFAFAAHRFFHNRIPVEEKLLMEFFPDEYPNFRKSTPIGIPFINAS